jgi:hypothetical protein
MDYCTREITMRISTVNNSFNRKISLLSCKLNVELRKTLVICYAWSIALHGSVTWTENLSGTICRASKCDGGEGRK